MLGIITFLVMVYNTHYKISVNSIRVCSALVGGHLSKISVIPGTWQVNVLILNAKEEVLRGKN